MCHFPLSSRADGLQPGELEQKMDFNGELDVDLAGGVDNDRDPQMLEISRHIIDEVDVEVAIRERLATTIEGRIQWALQLLEALSSVTETQDQPLEGDDFQDAALDALEALEAPSSFIFDTGFLEERSPSPSFSPVVPNPPVAQRMPKTRSSRTPKPSQQKKYLYLKLPSAAPDGRLVILACPTCGRTQFTTLQGLLNHARLAHGVEWASHDACITACAIPISADTQGWESYERDGIEVPWNGSVVGLRRLFERAVGVDGFLSTPGPVDASLDVSSENSAVAPSTLLSRTLGLHADSPALAQFLGRVPKRRCIHVYSEEQHIDITALDGDGPQPNGTVSEHSAHTKSGFHMRYPHRNAARKDLDLVVDVDSGVKSTRMDDAMAIPTIVPTGTTASRFHITARIRLEDRSLYLKEDRRSQLGTADQYRWILGVTAPSYSLQLSSFLTCVTVVPPRSISPEDLTVQQQPFAVMGTANEPFMAKVIFEWVGGGKMEVEHWIELDQFKSHTSVFGSEQLLDIELDRNTQLLPVPKGSPLPLPSLDRQLMFDSPLRNTSRIDSENGNASMVKEEYYEQVLRSLLPRVPMTAKDVKLRITTQVPYKLVASSAHLLALVPGRRKAIEWARARALHALYVERMASASPSQRTALTVGDVYTFLEDGSHFPRPSHPAPVPLPEPKRKGKEKDRTPILSEEFCSTCGVKKRLHPGYDVKREEGAAHWACVVVPEAEQRYGTRFPLIDLAKALASLDGLEQAVLGPPLPSASPIPIQALKIFLPSSQHTSRDLVTFNPPELILAVHKTISKLRLPTFPEFVLRREHPELIADRESTERCLAPAALLSATLKPFVSTLLRSAVEVAKRDATTVPGPKGGRGKRTKKVTFILTPGHILRGLRLLPISNLKAAPSVARSVVSHDPRARESAALCLTQFGVRHNFGEDISFRSGLSDEKHHTTVKDEPE